MLDQNELISVDQSETYFGSSRIKKNVQMFINSFVVVVTSYEKYFLFFFSFFPLVINFNNIKKHRI